MEVQAWASDTAFKNAYVGAVQAESSLHDEMLDALFEGDVETIEAAQRRYEAYKKPAQQALAAHGAAVVNANQAHGEAKQQLLGSPPAPGVTREVLQEKLSRIDETLYGALVDADNAYIGAIGGVQGSSDQAL